MRYYHLGASERSYSRGLGEVSVLGRPHRVLLGYRMIFEKCESLYCTLVTYILLYINYTSTKKGKSHRKRRALYRDVGLKSDPPNPL